MSPTALTLRYLRRGGYLVDVVERWIPRANIRRDCFGVGDLLAATVDESPLLVQATSLANVSARVKKAQASAALAVWLRTGARFKVFGWTLRQGRGAGDRGTSPKTCSQTCADRRLVRDEKPLADFGQGFAPWIQATAPTAR